MGKSKIPLLKRAARKLLTPFLWDYTSAEYQCGRLSFSQFGEDVICDFFFSRNFRGCYVDVGAFHPMTVSNTYGFYRRGWRGLCIDANPDIAGLFARFRPDDIFIYSAIGRETGQIEMALFADGAFNCLAEQMANVPDDVRRTARLVKVPINPLASILAERNIKEIDFLNVDCEGNDLNVLLSNDWSRWKPTVICVEDHADNWQSSEIVQFLGTVGYTLKYRAVLSSIFIPERIAREHSASRGLTAIA
jgi:FkbM family methyltransferase